MSTRNLGKFFVGDVDLGIRKVSEAPGMVGVAMRQNDVPHVFSRKPKSLDPANGSVRFVELKARQVDELLPQAFDRVADILEADACIYESQTLAVLKK